MIKRPVGRPRKTETVRPLTKEEDKKEKKRVYMRGYKAKLNKEIEQLDIKEEECQKELAEIRQQRKKLIDQVDEANKQAEKILKEATSVTGMVGKNKKY